MEFITDEFNKRSMLNQQTFPMLYSSAAALNEHHIKLQCVRNIKKYTHALADLDNINWMTL